MSQLLTTSTLQACVLGFRGGVSEATDEIWGFIGLVGGGEEGESAEGAGG